MNPETHAIDYKPKFEHSELETVKLSQQYDDGSKKQKYCPVFAGKHGIEALLFVEERFRKVAAQLEWADSELFDNFEEILVDTAEDDWEDIVGGIPEADRDDTKFDECMEKFYLKYCSNGARETMFEYLSTQCRKPVGEEPRTHVSRMKTLYRYSNKLPGTEPPKTEQQIKMPIFKTFPETWRQTFVRSGKDVTDPNVTLQTIIDFMTTEKAFADKSSDGNKKRKNDGDNKGNEKKKKKNEKQTNNGPESECRKHGNHKWKDCWDNPRGNNYRPNRGSGQGRGGGRNSYNRYNDRGGRGGNRSNNNNNYQNHNNRNDNRNDGQGQRNNNDGQNYHYQDNDQGRRPPEREQNRNGEAQARQQDAASDHYYMDERAQGTGVRWW